MKEFSKNKRGISLIVLVITIIVMIILAAAIILSLNSSDIIGKANEAKTSSDAANKKAAASVLLAEYELALVNGETTKTANEYVKEGLKAQGIDVSDIVITEDREILVGLSKVAVAFIDAGVQIGDTVTGYTLSQAASAKTYTTSGKENTWDQDDWYVMTDPQPATIERDDENNNIIWQYFGIDEKGNALLAASLTSKTPTMLIGGQGGYLDGPEELNYACEALYSSDKGKARSINIDDITRVLDYTGKKGEYRVTTYTSTTSTKTIDTKTPLLVGNILQNLKGDNIWKDGENYHDCTPDGSDMKRFKSDYYKIKSDSDKINKDRLDIIYTSALEDNLIDNYWVASKASWFWAEIYDSDYINCETDFLVRCVLDTGEVSGVMVYAGFDEAIGEEYSIRPVVELSDTVTIDTYNAESGVVTIK